MEHQLHSNGARGNEKMDNRSFRAVVTVRCPEHGRHTMAIVSQDDWSWLVVEFLKDHLPFTVEVMEWRE